jgi:type II secretory pathway component HofQ
MLLATSPTGEAATVGQPSEATTAIESAIVTFDARRGLLKVSAKHKPFRRVMGAVAEESGMDIFIHGSVQGELTVEFDYVPLERALKVLLKGKSFVISRSEDGLGIEKVCEARATDRAPARATDRAPAGAY